MGSEKIELLELQRLQMEIAKTTTGWLLTKESAITAKQTDDSKVPTAELLEPLSYLVLATLLQNKRLLNCFGTEQTFQ